jgi:hypothetical protein
MIIILRSSVLYQEASNGYAAPKVRRTIMVEREKVLYDVIDRCVHRHTNADQNERPNRSRMPTGIKLQKGSYRQSAIIDVYLHEQR